MKKNIVLLEIILLFLLSLIVFNICGCGTNPTSDGTHASKWNVSDVSNVTGGSNSLALDHNGNPKLCFSRRIVFHMSTGTAQHGFNQRLSAVQMYVFILIPLLLY